MLLAWNSSKLWAEPQSHLPESAWWRKELAHQTFSPWKTPWSPWSLCLPRPGPWWPTWVACIDLHCVFRWAQVRAAGPGSKRLCQLGAVSARACQLRGQAEHHRLTGVAGHRVLPAHSWEPRKTQLLPQKPVQGGIGRDPLCGNLEEGGSIYSQFRQPVLLQVATVEVQDSLEFRQRLAEVVVQAVGGRDWETARVHGPS